MHNNCQCSHSHHQQHLHKSNEGLKLSIHHQKINKLISLLQNAFISPYKIMFLLDPKQADYFKGRNQSIGCCSSNHVTIPDDECSKTERFLKQYISYSFLFQNIDKIMNYCLDRFQNIIASGKKDNLAVTTQTQKFILDKVLTESVNNFIYLKLAQRIQAESNSLNRQIGLWATPATWFQKYPKVPLNSIPNQLISEIIDKGWSIQSKYFQSNIDGITRQLTLLEKDGKFQACSLPKQSQNQVKILNNPQVYSEILDSHQKFLFGSLRQLIILFHSFPFQLNYKANLFCTTGSNFPIYYFRGQFLTKEEKGQLQYTVLANFGKSINVSINKQKQLMDQGSLLFINSNRVYYKIHAEGQGDLFILRNYIGCVPTK